MIQYTSGTMDFPKGAVLSHRGLVNNARFYASRCGAGNHLGQHHADVPHLGLRHGHAWLPAGGLPEGAGQPVRSGCCAGSTGRYPCRYHPWRADHGGGTSGRARGASAGPVGPETGQLRRLDGGPGTGAPGAGADGRRVQALMGAGFSTLYGQTEHCPVITQHHLGDSIYDICNTAGQPVAQTEVSIRAVADNHPVAIGEIGEIGEICARGPCVMLEYNDNPRASAGTVDAEGWLHTGDQGRMDARGYVTVTGRVKEMIIRGGENHFPAEIENLLLEHPDIAEVAVVGLPDPKWGEVIGSFLRCAGPLDKAALHAHCRAKMSPQKTPNVWVQVDGFPLTGSGEIQKFILRDRFVAGEFIEL